MLTTQQARDAWGPPCQGARTTVLLFGDGTVSVRTQIVAAVGVLDACLRAANYRTRKAVTGAYNCRKITGGTGYSLHAYGIALDINWDRNPYGPKVVTDMPPSMIAAIKAIRTNNGRQVWRWGGDYTGNKDAMHFEIVCTPADLATGIAGPHQEDDLDDTEKYELKSVFEAVGRLEQDAAQQKQDLAEIKRLLTDKKP